MGLPASGRLHSSGPFTAAGCERSSFGSECGCVEQAVVRRRAHGAIRATELPIEFVYQRFPSGPEVIVSGVFRLPLVNVVTAPDGETLPMTPGDAVAVNQRLP